MHRTRPDVPRFGPSVPPRAAGPRTRTATTQLDESGPRSLTNSSPLPPYSRRKLEPDSLTMTTPPSRLFRSGEAAPGASRVRGRCETSPSPASCLSMPQSLRRTGLARRTMITAMRWSGGSRNSAAPISRRCSERSASDSGPAAGSAGSGARISGRRRSIERYCRPARPAAQLVGTGVRRDAQEPRPERIALAAGDMAEGGEKRILSDIICKSAAPEHAAAQVIDEALMEVDQLVERAQVAVPRAPQQLQLFRRHTFRGPARLDSSDGDSIRRTYERCRFKVHARIGGLCLTKIPCAGGPRTNGPTPAAAVRMPR